MSNYVINPSRFEVSCCVFASIYEAKQALTTVQKQRFVCWFSGGSISSVWTETCIGGGGSVGMSDSIDGGYFMTTGSCNNDRKGIDFGQIEQYEETGAVIIWVAKADATGNTVLRVGTGAIANFGGCSYHAGFLCANTNFAVQAHDGCSATCSETSNSKDACTHVHKLEFNTCDVEYTLCGGCICVTHSCTLPMCPQAPMANILTKTGGGSATVNLRYVEAYNT